MQSLRGDYCSSKLGAASLIFETEGASLVASNREVSLLKLDRDGVLLAVVFVNGHVKFYDSDECLGRLQLDGGKTFTPSVKPVLCIDARRPISDLVWSLWDADEIFLSFRSTSFLHMYNLNRECTPRRILEVGSDFSGGHNVIVCVPNKRGKRLVIVGSASGSIVQWDSESRPKQASWCVSVDPSKRREAGCAVVGLALSPNWNSESAINSDDPTLLVALTRAGSLSVFDVVNLKVPPFGLQPSPVCLKRIQLWDSFISLFGIDPEPCVSLYLPVTFEPSTASISTESGSILKFDLRRSVPVDVAGLVADSRKRKAQVLQGLQAIEVTSQHQNTVLPTTVICRPVYPDWFGASVQLCCSAVQGTCVIRVFDICCRNKDSSGVGGCGLMRMIERNCLGLQSKTVRNNMSKTMQMRKWSSVGQMKDSGGGTAALSNGAGISSITLPGRVMNATEGSFLVEVSDDLRDYLASAHVADASLNKLTNEVWFDWETPHQLARAKSFGNAISFYYGEAEKENKGYNTLFVDAEGRACISGSYNSVERVQGTITSHNTHSSPPSVTLSRPYCGPDVVDGSPHVLIRTNLVPTTQFITSSGVRKTNPSFSYSKEFLSPVTALEAHPTLPILFAGLSDGSLRLLSPDGAKVDDDALGDDEIYVCEN